MGGKRASIGPRCAFCLRSAQQAPCRPPVGVFFLPTRKCCSPHDRVSGGYLGLPWVTLGFRMAPCVGPRCASFGPHPIAAFVAYLFFVLLFGRCGCRPSSALPWPSSCAMLGGCGPRNPRVWVGEIRSFSFPHFPRRRLVRIRIVSAARPRFGSLRAGPFCFLLW